LHQQQSRDCGRELLHGKVILKRSVIQGFLKARTRSENDPDAFCLHPEITDNRNAKKKVNDDIAFALFYIRICGLIPDLLKLLVRQDRNSHRMVIHEEPVRIPAFLPFIHEQAFI
jgi:hypothetical protein